MSVNVGLCSQLAPQLLDGRMENEADIAHRKICDAADFHVAEIILEFEPHNFLLPAGQGFDQLQDLVSALLEFDHFVR